MRYLNLIKNLSNWPLYLAVKFGFNKDEPILFITRSGIRIEVPRRLLQTFKEIFMEECYMTGLGHPVPVGATVIDIGANAGYFSMYAASRFKNSRVLAFEPILANFVQLERNIQFNNDSRVIGVQKAVYKETGELSLHYDPNDSFTTSATLFQREQEPGVIQVTAIELAEVFTEYEIESCELLKLDCEGAEFDILYHCGDCLPRIQQIAMEVHAGSEPEQNIEFLESFLTSNGFVTRTRFGRMLWAWREKAVQGRGN